MWNGWYKCKDRIQQFMSELLKIRLGKKESIRVYQITFSIINVIVICCHKRPCSNVNCGFDFITNFNLFPNKWLLKAMTLWQSSSHLKVIASITHGIWLGSNYKSFHLFQSSSTHIISFDKIKIIIFDLIIFIIHFFWLSNLIINSINLILF